MLKASRKARKALYVNLIDSLSWPDLEEYAFERWTTYDVATRKPCITSTPEHFAFNS